VADARGMRGLGQEKRRGIGKGGCDVGRAHVRDIDAVTGGARPMPAAAR
jgi:hypothetical protein